MQNSSSSTSPKSTPLYMRKWRNHVTPRASVFTLFGFGVVFLAFGLCFRFLTEDLRTYSVRYDEICHNVSSPCIVNIHIEQTLQGRIALLYELQEYYQNHRRMFNSKSYGQLGGKYVTNSLDLSGCSPVITKGGSKSQNDLYIPCGLMALSFFTDYYRWLNTSVGTFKETEIAQPSDVKHLFKPINANYTRGIRVLLDKPDFPGETVNEHFIIWMRAAAMPTFLKLFARCDDCVIPAGDYPIEVKMNYPKSMFHGARSIVITKAGGLGSGSHFLGITFISTGSFSLFIALVFSIHMLFCPRQFGDLSSIWEPKINSRHRLEQRLLSNTEDNEIQENPVTDENN